MKRNEIREAIMKLGVFFLDASEELGKKADTLDNREERHRAEGGAAAFELASGLLRALWGEIPTDESPAAEPPRSTYSVGGYL